jgi:hypothetical protein
VAVSGTRVVEPLCCATAAFVAVSAVGTVRS